jgi:hypothetical protein
MFFLCCRSEETEFRRRALRKSLRVDQKSAKHISKFCLIRKCQSLEQTAAKLRFIRIAERLYYVFRCCMKAVTQRPFRHSDFAIFHRHRTTMDDFQKVSVRDLQLPSMSMSKEWVSQEINFCISFPIKYLITQISNCLPRMVESTAPINMHYNEYTLENSWYKRQAMYVPYYR